MTVLEKYITDMETYKHYLTMLYVGAIETKKDDCAEVINQVIQAYSCQIIDLRGIVGIEHQIVTDRLNLN